MKHHHIALTAFCIAAILLTGCGNAGSVSTDASRSSASGTEPSGETKERWLTGPVTAIVARAPGECFYCYFSLPPEAVLYADGRQIVAQEFRLYERRLSDAAMCSLLTEIDGSGYFEYTGDRYEQFYKSHAMKPGPEQYWIDIDAWKSNSLDLPSFGFLFELHKDEVEWPDALRIPYEKLAKVDPTAMQSYLPERVAVHIEQDPDLGFELADWTVSSISLPELIARYKEISTPASDSSEGELILEGAEAAAVIEQFNDRAWGAENIFVLDQQRYVVAVRALLPYEAGGGRDGSRPLIPDPAAEYSPVSRNCAGE